MIIDDPGCKLSIEQSIKWWKRVFKDRLKVKVEPIVVMSSLHHQDDVGNLLDKGDYKPIYISPEDVTKASMEVDKSVDEFIKVLNQTMDKF
jgi:hypothetical protein